MQILPNGRVKIKNFETGEEKEVDPGELFQYGGDSLFNQYTKLKDLQTDGDNGFQISTGNGLPNISQTNTSITSTGGYTKEKYLSDLERDIRTTGGKNRAALEQLFKGYNPEMDVAADSEARKRSVILQQAAPVLGRIVTAGMKAPIGWEGWWKATTGQLPGVAGGEAEYLARDTEGFARLIASAFASEVGVATNRDVNRWLKIMPRPGDTMEERIRQSRELINQIQMEAASLRIEVPPSVIEAAKLIPDKKDKQTLGDIDKTNFSQTTLSPINQPPTNGKSGGVLGMLGVTLPGINDRPTPKKEPNFLADIITPRAADVARKQNRGENISLDERLGVTGEVANRFVSPFFGPLGFAAGGALEAATEPGKPLEERGIDAMRQAAIQGILGKSVQMIGKGAQALGIGAKGARFEAAQAAEMAGIRVGDNSSTINIAKQMLKKNLTGPEFEPIIKELAKGKGILPVDAVKLLVRATQKTFTKGGDMRLANQAEYYALLRDGLRESLSKYVPEIITQTSRMARGYKLEDLIKKASFYLGPTAGLLYIGSQIKNIGGGER